MPNESSELLSSPPLVAVAGWLLPGAGYLLLGEIGRGVTIGVSILSLFVLGLLIAGVRVVEVPGYDSNNGQPIMLHNVWVMKEAPLLELKNKLWSVPQALTGPVAFIAGAYSIHAAEPDPNRPGHSLGSQTHARVNEIGALYLSVAGLLNLMTIIDSTWRAMRRIEEQSGEQVGA